MYYQARPGQKENVMTLGIKPRMLVALLATAGCLTLVACSSNSPSSSNTTTPTPTSAPTTASSPTDDPTKASAADCVILKPIATDALNKLSAMQGLSPAKAASTMQAYVAELQQALPKLTSPVGKSALSGYIAALGKAATEDQATATNDITKALGALSSACP
jgi:hypothetical protein